jgi:hypothetical protein
MHQNIGLTETVFGKDWTNAGHDEIGKRAAR